MHREQPVGNLVVEPLLVRTEPAPLAEVTGGFE